MSAPDQNLYILPFVPTPTDMKCMAFVSDLRSQRIVAAYFTILLVLTNPETGKTTGFYVQQWQDAVMTGGGGAMAPTYVDTPHGRINPRRVSPNGGSPVFLPLGSAIVDTPAGKAICTPNLEYVYKDATTWGFVPKEKAEEPAAEPEPGKSVDALTEQASAPSRRGR